MSWLRTRRGHALLMLRWIRADLRGRRGQALLSIGVIAGIVVAQIVAVTLLEGALNPWRGLFARSNGAHVWIYTSPGTDLQPLARLDGVTALAGPYQTAAAKVSRNGRLSPLELRAMGSQRPEIARPLMRGGHWLDSAEPDGIVLEHSFARALRIGTGDHLQVQGLDGVAHPFTVIGIADTSDQGPYPDRPGLAWTQPRAFTEVQPVARNTAQLVGLRLADPGLTDFVAQRANTVLPEGSVGKVSTWRAVRAEMEVKDRLLGLLLGLFGVVGLIAAALAIANITSGWVLARLQDIATLKTLGCTPGQVVRILVLEQSALGLAGIGLGILAAEVLTSPWPSSVLAGSALGEAASPTSPRDVLIIAAGTGSVLFLATLLPAWRGSRVSPVAAVGSSPPGGRLSQLARLAILVRLPPALVLGVRDAFTRRLRAGLAIVGLAVPMAMATIALGCLATLDNFEAHPEQIGLAAPLTADPVGIESAAAANLINADPQVAAAYPSADIEALLPGETRTIHARAAGTSDRPYPFPVVAGRLYRAPGEAVAGQGLLRALNAKIGQRVRLKIGGTPVIFTIVGRTIEPRRNGEVLSFGMDTLSDAQPATSPVFYQVVLTDGANADAVRSRLAAASGNRLDVRPVSNPAGRLGAVRVLVPGLIAVLALIGLANLLTVTSVGLRDHVRDVGVLRAIGLTPRQVLATLVTGTGVLAVVAVTVGVTVGTSVSAWLIDTQGRASGMGAGIGRAPTPGMLVVASVVATMMAALTALIPALREAHGEVSSILRDPLARPGQGLFGRLVPRALADRRPRPGAEASRSRGRGG